MGEQRRPRIVARALALAATIFLCAGVIFASPRAALAAGSDSITPAINLSASNVGSSDAKLSWTNVIGQTAKVYATENASSETQYTINYYFIFFFVADTNDSSAFNKFDVDKAIADGGHHISKADVNVGGSKSSNVDYTESDGTCSISLSKLIANLSTESKNQYANYTAGQGKTKYLWISVCPTTGGGWYPNYYCLGALSTMDEVSAKAVATVTTSNGAKTSYPSLQAAIAAANSGDTVSLAEGVKWSEDYAFSNVATLKNGAKVTLNNKTYEAAANSSVTVDNEGVLHANISNSSSGGTLKASAGATVRVGENNAYTDVASEKEFTVTYEKGNGGNRTVGTFGKGDSVTIGGMKFTSGAEGQSFPINAMKGLIAAEGSKAETVQGHTAAVGTEIGSTGGAWVGFAGGSEGSVTKTSSGADVAVTSGTVMLATSLSNYGKSVILGGDDKTFSVDTTYATDTTDARNIISMPEGGTIKALGTDTPTYTAQAANTKAIAYSDGTVVMDCTSAGNGKMGVSAGETLTVLIPDETGTGTKKVTVTAAQAFSVDASSTPAKVGTLEAGQSATINGVTYTASADGTSFPIQDGKGTLTNTGDKATVPSGTATTVVLSDGNDTTTNDPAVTVPSSNSGSTTVEKTADGGKVTVEKSGNKFTAGDTEYTAKSDGATFEIGSDGKTALTGGSVEVPASKSISVNSTDVTAGSSAIVVNKDDDGTATVEIPAGYQAKIGDTLLPEPTSTQKTIVTLDKDGNITEIAEGDKDNAAASVKNGIKTTYYSSLDTALLYAGNGSTVEMLKTPTSYVGQNQKPGVTLVDTDGVAYTTGSAASFETAWEGRSSGTSGYSGVSGYHFDMQDKMKADGYTLEVSGTDDAADETRSVGVWLGSSDKFPVVSSTKDFTLAYESDDPQPKVIASAAGQEITIGGVKHTAVNEGDAFYFTYNSSTLVADGSSATVPAGTGTTVSLGVDGPAIAVPSDNSDSTTVTKTADGGMVELASSGDTFTVGEKSYKAASNGATFSIGKDDEGNETVTLSSGSAKIGDGVDIIGTSGKTIANPASSGTDEVTVEAGTGDAEGTDKVTVPTGGSVDVADEDGKTASYPNKGANDMVLTVGPKGTTLTSGTTEIGQTEPGNVITAGESGLTVTNTNNDDPETKITVSSSDGKDTVTVPKGEGNSVTIGETDYTNPSSEADMVIEVGTDKQPVLTGGSAVLNPGEGIKVGGAVITNPADSGKDIVVTAGENGTGTVTVPAGGVFTFVDTDGKTHTITNTDDEPMTFTIGSDGKITTPSLKTGDKVNIDGVDYEGASDGDNNKISINQAGVVTIDPNASLAVDIDPDKFSDPDFTYTLIPGQPVTVGKYVYEAPTGNTNTTLSGHAEDAENTNPIVTIGDSGKTIDVSLSATPATKTTYTAAAATTKFQMAKADADTTKIDLLSNGQADESAVKLTGTKTKPISVNGVSYAADSDDAEITVTYGTATVTTGSGDNTKTETVNRNAVTVGTNKVIATFSVAGQSLSVADSAKKVGTADVDATANNFTAANAGASVLLDGSATAGTVAISGANGCSLTAVKDANGTVTGYTVTRPTYSGGTSSSGEGVNVPKTEHGTITVDPADASKGEKVTITATPDKGYKLGTIEVVDKNGKAVELKQESDGTFTFTMPEGGVTIKATFVDEDGVADPAATGIADTLVTDPHIAYMHGYGNSGVFGVDATLTRAEAAQIFYNLLKTKPAGAKSTFKDVASDAWYADAVAALSSMGVIKGVGGTGEYFEPDRAVTRAEFCAMAMRLAKAAPEAASSFTDVASGDWYSDVVLGAVSYGWIHGYSDSTFRPNASITRAEAATVVNRMLARSADKAFVDANASSLAQFSDLKASHWGYYEVMEAANAHDHSGSYGSETWDALTK